MTTDNGSTVPYGRIYCIINTVNGKRYIGQTTCSIEVRWRQHCALQGKCRAIESAIRKYGPDAFTINEIATASTRDELNRAEADCVNRENTYAPHGYNLKGGGGAAGKMHAETRAKMRDLGKSPARLAALAEMMTRPDVISRQSEAKRKRWADPENRIRYGEAISRALNDPQTKARRSAIMTESYARPEVRARLAEAMAEVRARLDVRAKQSAATTRAWADPAAHTKRAEAIRAAKSTPEFKARYAATNALPEVKARRSASAKGRKATPEQRAAQSARQTGKKLGPQDRSYLTPEFKARRREAIIAGKARAKAAKNS